MTCNCPVHGWLIRDDDGNRHFTMSVRRARRYGGESVTVPCQKCNGCKSDRRLQKAIQCWAEANTWQNNCYITLTIDDDHMPSDYGLDKKMIQNFKKRLREKYCGLESIIYDGEIIRPIRTFECGEYGDEPAILGSPLGRPHFHIILFNFKFDDVYFWKYNDKGFPVYRSPKLEALWPCGFSIIEEFDIGVAMYVSGYVEKKRHGHDEVFYVHPLTGEIRLPEYSQSSTCPGMGYFYFKKYNKEMYANGNDFIMPKSGQKFHLPKYFDKLAERFEVVGYESIKDKRRNRAKEHEIETESRLLQKEEFLQARLDSIKERKKL